MHKTSAFTLIELLITIAILGILMGIAYPLYSDHLIKTRRVQASQNLLLLSQALEIYHSKQRTYLDADLVKLAPNIVNNNIHYRYQIQELTAQSYTLIALPSRKDSACGALSLDQLGEKSSNGTATVNECWLT